MAALTFEQVHQKLSARFPDGVGPAQPPKKDAFCTFTAARLFEIARFMKAEPELAFDHLQDLTATDHPKEGLIRVVYHFYSYTHRHQFCAKVELPRAAPEVDTLESVWKSANWFEREVFDLFGVTFKSHSDLRRIMLPDDWVGHPLRKDYQEAGSYQGISNIRDNPLDLFLTLDRANRPEAPPAPPAAPAAAAAPGTPAKSEA
jgi:NADH-quinone oxidoreductase subunit C